MANGVSLAEVQKFFEKYKDRTWAFDGRMKTMEVKYFSLNFDTRTGLVFRVDVYGGSKEIGVHVGDSNESENILDALERKLGWEKKANG